MLNRKCFENSRPDGFSVLEVVGEVDDGSRRRFVPLKRTELVGELFGPVAALRLTQVFGYGSSDCDRVLEAVYRFPLPGNAAVTAVRVQFGDATIRATLAERGQAEADYEDAKAQGRQAALATRESPDVFTLQVAGLKPDQEVTVETSFVELARPEGTGWSLRLPLTTAPRYVRGDEADSRAAAGQPLALLRDPGHRFSIDLAIRGAGVVESPSHRLDVQADGGRKRVRLVDREVVPDRDCVLKWQPERAEAIPSLQVLLHDDPGTGQVYFLALVAPPATRDAGRGPAREVTLLVDHSGSMEGSKWQAADWAVERFLSDLSDRDAFGLGLFHSSTRWFANSLSAATPRAVEKAVTFLKTHRDSGGTELGVALEQALSLPRKDGDAARHVLLVTDAEVSDAERVLRLADNEAGLAGRRRISVLCIDAAPNAYLALELAERGGGVARFLTSDPEQDDIATALDDVLADWSEPVLAGLRLEIDRGAVQAPGRATTQGGSSSASSVDLGDLPAGRPLWVIGRVPRGESDTLSLRLGTSRGQELASVRQPLTGEIPEGRALKALFGARQLIGLEHLVGSGLSGEALQDGLRRLGYDPAEALASSSQTPPKIYAENVRADARSLLHALLVRESLDFGLACSETAFLAVRTEAGKVIEDRVMVASALPAGWSESFLGGSARRYRSRFRSGAGDSSTLIAMADMPPPPMACAAPAAAPSPAPKSRPRLFGMMSGRGSARKQSAPPSLEKSETTSPAAVVFSGTPGFAGGEFVLFDSTDSTGVVSLPDAATIGRLILRFLDRAPDQKTLDDGLVLSVFVDDLALPRARVRVKDLVRQNGERPLNLRRSSGERVRIVLVDPAGAWANSAPRIEVSLGW